MVKRGEQLGLFLRFLHYLTTTWLPFWPACFQRCPLACLLAISSLNSSAKSSLHHHNAPPQSSTILHFAATLCCYRRLLSLDLVLGPDLVIHILFLQYLLHTYKVTSSAGHSGHPYLLFDLEANIVDSSSSLLGASVFDPFFDRHPFNPILYNKISTQRPLVSITQE